jgi:hypothetical protein
MSSEFLARVVAEGRKEIQAFADKAVSPFTLNATRYDSWLATMASEAHVSQSIARRWLDLLTHEYRYLSPEPRIAWMFNPNVGAMSRLFILTRGNHTSSDRVKMAAMFPASFSALLRGIRTPDMTFWLAFVPRGQLERSINIAYRIAPEARFAIAIESPLGRIGYKSMCWFDGSGCGRAVDAIQRYTAAVPRVARGEWSIAKFQAEVTRPVEDILNSI